MTGDPRQTPADRTVVQTAPPRDSQLREGTELNGIFVIDSLLARGGMGEVYVGRSIQTGDKVAIKVIRADLAESETALALFRREASALYNLNHEAIARFFLFSVDPVIQRAYLAMEFVEGSSIEKLIASGKPMAFEDVAMLSHRVALGLQAAHDVGIIHRDISPDNIILAGGDARKAKIIDFGIARSTQLSNTTVIGGGFAGKYNFVSPEQLGLYDGDVRAASDIYSLGLVMAAALSGKPIDMSGSQVDVINKRRAVPDLGAVDARFVPLLTRMLEPDPLHRPASMLEVAEACQAAVGRVTHASGATTGLRTPDRDWSRPAPETTSSTTARRTPSGKASGIRPMVVAGVVSLAIVAAGAGYLVLTQPALQAPAITQPPVAPLSQPDAPPVKTAMTPTTPAGPTSSPAAPRNEFEERVHRFIERYDGGHCFKITSTAPVPTGPTIEGIGQSAEPFNALDKAFKAAIGVEASIEFKTVTPSQCAAVSFLGRTRFEAANAPRIETNVSELLNGQSLTGTVTAMREQNLEVLHVTEDGFVQNVTGVLRALNQRSFSIRMERPVSAAPKPQLLIAVATGKPLPSLQIPRPVHGDRFFPSLASDANEQGIELGVSFQYIIVD